MKRFRELSEKAATKLDEPRLSVAPLIDVCFLLLIYFMVTTTIKPPERDLSTELAREGAASPRVGLTVMIHVREDGAVVLNPGPHELYLSVDPDERGLPRLEEHLAGMMLGGRDRPPVMVRADGGAEHQRVVDVMNVLNKVGWTEVGFLDEPDEE